MLNVNKRKLPCIADKKFEMTVTFIDTVKFRAEKFFKLSSI